MIPSGCRAAFRILRVIIPSLEEVEAYFTEQGFPIDHQSFYDHYESLGWMKSITLSRIRRLRLEIGPAVSCRPRRPSVYTVSPEPMAVPMREASYIKPHYG